MIVQSGEYYRVSVKRSDIRLVCSVSTYEQAKETERMMTEDAIVDLRHYRYCFNPGKIFIIKKPNITPKYYAELSV
jgi:hypothetical protein